MDISKASNFERFVFDLLDRDAARVTRLFGEELAAKGCFEITAEERARIGERYGFVSGRSTHEDRVATIRQCHAQYGVIIDTHTADGLKVALDKRQPGVPMLVLETALPAKFAATIEEALGLVPPRPAALDDLESRPKRVTVLPVSVDQVKQFIVDHV
jgi:threonine synthase